MICLSRRSAPWPRLRAAGPGRGALAPLPTAPLVSEQDRRREVALAAALFAMLGAALPIVVSTARAMADHWMPAGDQGIIATRAYDVLGSHTPLVGQYSLVSNLTGHLTYSPGPMLYWLIALPARYGSPTTIALAMGIANALAAAGIVVLARRRGGVPLMLATAAVVALMCRSFMPEAMHDPWNPSAGLLALTLLVFLGWSLACGEYRLLPLAALVGSFTAQCQVAFLAPTLGLLAIGLLGFALSRRSARPSGRLWPWALATLAVLALCWAAPVIQQIEHSPGNLALLYRAATEHSRTLGARAGARAVIRAVGIVPRWLRVPGDPFDSRLSDVTGAPSTFATVSCLVLLAGLLLAGLAGAWRRRIDIAAAAAIGLALAAGLASVAARTPVSEQKVLGYTLWWGSIAGMFVWLALGFSLVALVREALRARRRAIPQTLNATSHRIGLGQRVALACMAGAIAVLTVGVLVAAAQPRDAHRAEYGPIASIEHQLNAAHIPKAGAVWLQSSLSGVASPLSQAVKFLLRREGLRVLQYGATARLGPWYEIDHRPYKRIVYAYDRHRPRDPRARIIAQATMSEDGRPHHVLVALAPAPAARRAPRSSR